MLTTELWCIVIKKIAHRSAAKKLKKTPTNFRALCKTTAHIPVQINCKLIYFGCVPFSFNSTTIRHLEEMNLTIIHITHLSLDLREPYHIPQLPNSVTHLVIKNVTPTILRLPISLLYLEINSVPQSLPVTLRYLKITTTIHNLSHSGHGELPNLTHLILDCYDIIFNYTTPVLTYLEIKRHFKNCFKSFPPTLTHLIIDDWRTVFSVPLPAKLKHFRCLSSLGITSQLPDTLEYLYLINSQGVRFPASLKTLIIGLVEVEHDLSHLKSLKNLDITTESAEICYPSNLKRLNLCHRRLVPALLPSSLKYLRFHPYSYRTQLDINLTCLDSLKSFTLKCDDKCNIVLPESLEVLILTDTFIRNLPYLPKSLTTLGLSKLCLQSLDAIPEGIIKLYLGESHARAFNMLPEMMKELILERISARCQHIKLYDYKTDTELK